MTPVAAFPQLETARLVLRLPRIEDFEPFRAFYASDRARFVGGPSDNRRRLAQGWGNVAGLWLMRGYSFFVLERREDARPIGHAGAWFPIDWPEPEFGWTLWSHAVEGKGYVTEAMRAIIPWAWKTTGAESFISVIDEGNTASVRVAEALGAMRDDEATAGANAPGSAFSAEGEPPVEIWRHRRPG